MNRKPPSKWASLGERVAKLKDGESIALECEGSSPTEQARKVRNGLKSLAACAFVQCAVRSVEGKIVITRVGTWPVPPPILSAYRAGVRLRQSRC